MLLICHISTFLTRSGFAYCGVLGAKLETLHTQTVEAAVRVDAPLRARVSGRAFIYVNTSLPVIFQMKAGMASALWGSKAQSR